MSRKKQTVLGIAISLTLILFSVPLTLQAHKAAEADDTAIPAVTDFPLLGMPQPANPDQLSTRSYASEFRLLDINQDLHLNEFDIKHFQAIVERFNAEDLTGLQLSTRFRNAQKNQEESFPLLYDLDRDGYFSQRDVDNLHGLVDELDQGASRGKDLVHEFRMRIFPPKKK